MSRSAVTCVALAHFACAAHLPLFAETTNEVDIAALLEVAVNNVTTNAAGWTLNSIGRYSDPDLQFNAGDDWMLSPDYGIPILRLEFSVRCSASATRRLVVADESTGAEVCRFLPCAVGNKDEMQSFDFAAEEGLTQFRLKINTDDGNSGNWGIGRIVVVTADPVFAPTGLAVVRTNANYCVLAWENGANTVSNRVDTLLVERGAGETALLETGFDNFTAGRNPVQSDDKLPQVDAALSGVNIYAPTNTSGICQIGKGKELGFIRYDGIADYSNVVLRLRAKRYPGDNAETTIVSVDPAGMTNEVETIVLVADYADYEINLSSITNEGSALLIGYYKTKSNRRVLLDSMSIVRLSADGETQVDSRFISAAPGPVCFRMPFDLEPKAEYRFSVRAVNGDGIMSDAATVEVHVDRPQGAAYYLR